MIADSFLQKGCCTTWLIWDTSLASLLLNKCNAMDRSTFNGSPVIYDVIIDAMSFG